MQIRFIHYRKVGIFGYDEPIEIQDLRREITIWKKAVENMYTSYSRDEDLVRDTLARKIELLGQKLNRQIFLDTTMSQAYIQTLRDLQVKVRQPIVIFYYCKLTIIQVI